MNSSATANEVAPALIDRVIEQLEPLIARQRRAIAREGCLRAMSSTQLHVLFLLDGEGPLAMGRLAELLDVSLPNVTGIVDRMVEHGLVERGRDEGDRRVVTVMPTPAGEAAVEEIDLLKRRQLQDVLARLTPDEQERALRTFTDLRRAAESLDAARPPD